MGCICNCCVCGSSSNRNQIGIGQPSTQRSAAQATSSRAYLGHGDLEVQVRGDGIPLHLEPREDIYHARLRRRALRRQRDDEVVLVVCGVGRQFWCRRGGFGRRCGGCYGRSEVEQTRSCGGCPRGLWRSRGCGRVEEAEDIVGGALLWLGRRCRGSGGGCRSRTAKDLCEKIFIGLVATRYGDYRFRRCR